MNTASARDLRHKTSALLKEVRRGRKIVITFRGRSVAALVPLERVERNELNPVGFGMWRGRRDMRSVEKWLKAVRAPRHRPLSSTRTS